MKNCQEKTEVYSRVVGFFRPVQQWNDGKKEEYNERVAYDLEKFKFENKYDVDYNAAHFDP